jgi:REP element-mobilizing transposase RayT
MPSAYTQNYYHAVFSTKLRASLITPDLEDRLYPFIGGIMRDLRCTLLAINGMPDHIHLLVRYRSDLSHSDMLQQIKGRSSKWINDTFPERGHFA